MGRGEGLDEGGDLLPVQALTGAGGGEKHRNDGTRFVG